MIHRGQEQGQSTLTHLEMELSPVISSKPITNPDLLGKLSLQINVLGGSFGGTEGPMATGVLPACWHHILTVRLKTAVLNDFVTSLGMPSDRTCGRVHSYLQAHSCSYLCIVLPAFGTGRVGNYGHIYRDSLMKGNP